MALTEAEAEAAVAGAATRGGRTPLLTITVDGSQEQVRPTGVRVEDGETVHTRGTYLLISICLRLLLHFGHRAPPPLQAMCP